MPNDILEKTFSVSGSPRLALGNIRGSVDIRPGTDGVITVKAEKFVNTGDAKATEIEVTQEPDGTVNVKTRFWEFWLGWLFGSKPCKVNYTVTVPRNCALEVNGVSNELFVEGFEADGTFKTVSGEMTVRASNGSLNFESVSGDMKLSDLTGDLRLNTVSGDVKGTHLSGTLSLKTVSGEVDFDQSTLQSVRATTVSGGMELETDLGDGPYKFDSVSGGLTMKLPADVHCTAELQTVSGDLSINLPATSVSRHGGRQVTEVQGGGVKVMLKSISGNMEITS
ncbi:MAG: hypothetical protein C4583_02760 [Anaerolineaceae bacterium]|nr:MAG: hypothetical protein C4583_02760 [Anaerolineaceae bacterium]